MATIVNGNPKAPFLIVTTPRCRGGCYSFPGLLYFTLDPYLIMLSVKQGGIKYHFLSLWYDSTWDWTQVSRALANTLTHRPIYINIYIYIFFFFLCIYIYIYIYILWFVLMQLHIYIIIYIGGCIYIYMYI